MLIVTLAYNRPDFIELQLNSIKKWVKDFEYLVFDNSLDDQVEKECKRLGIESIKVSSHGGIANANASGAITQMWKILHKKKGILTFLDSDMFVVAPLPDIKDYDAAFVYLYATGIKYPWASYWMFNLDTFPHPEEIDWRVGIEFGGCTGSYISFFLDKYKPKVLELDAFTMYDPGKTFHRTSVVSNHPNFAKLEELCIKYDFPHPWAIDIITTRRDLDTMKGGTFEDRFIFHYKSGANYVDYCTPEYNRLKTIALHKVL